MQTIMDGAAFTKEVLESPIPVVVDFYADWCPPCKMYAPVFEQAAAKLGDRVKFVKVNVDSAREVASEYAVMSIPATMMFKGGKAVGSVTGAYAEEDLVGWIEQRL